MDNDDARMDGIEEGLAERIGSCILVGGGHQNVGVKIIGAGEQGELAFVTEMGKKENPDAVNVAEQNDGVVFGAGRRRGAVRVQHGPRAEMIADF